MRGGEFTVEASNQAPDHCFVQSATLNGKPLDRCYLKMSEFNPEAWIFCTDPDGEVWRMRYVYYNGKTFSPKKSTRNEYRITYMTKFFSKWSARAEDTVVFTATNRNSHYRISIQKKDQESKPI